MQDEEKKLWRKMIHRTGGCWSFPPKKNKNASTKSDPAFFFIRPFFVATGETRLLTLGVRVRWESTSCRLGMMTGHPQCDKPFLLGAAHFQGRTVRFREGNINICFYTLLGTNIPPFENENKSNMLVPWRVPQMDSTTKPL